MSAEVLAILVPLSLFAAAPENETRQVSLRFIESDGQGERLRQALSYARRRDWPAAFREIDLAYRADPSNAVVCYNFAAFYFNTEDYPNAVPWFRKAHKFEPGRFEFQYGLASALEASGDTEAALQEYSRLISRHPRNPAAFNGRAWVQLRRGDHDAAAADALRALTLDRDLVGAMYIGARVAEGRGAVSDALRAYEEILDLEPAHLNALYRLTVLSRRAGNPESAQRYARSFQALKSRVEAQSAVLRGVRALRRAQYGPAAADFRSATSQDDKNGEAWYYLGISQQQLGDLPGSADSLRRAIALNPEPAAPHAWLGVTLAALQHPEADVHLDQAIRSAGKDPEPFVTAARGYMILKDWPAAEAALKQGLQVSPAHPSALAELFHLYATQERYTQARGVADAAAELNPGDARLLYRIGLFWAAMEEFGRARRTLEQALSVDPQNNSIRALLGKLPQTK